jgi:hypothetical protein
MRQRRSKHSHHGIADELFDRPTERLDALARPSVVRGDPRLHLLRVRRFRRGREAD